MALGGCFTCIKYLMFAFNFLFWLLGCAILGVGIWFRVDQNIAQYVNHSSEVNLFYTLAYILIAVGIIIMVIGFLGCCGAIRESQCMLGTFFVFLFIIFAALLAAGIYAIVAKDELKSATQQMLKDGVDNYSNEESKAFMDTIQTQLNCCGAVKGSMDYKVTTGVPKSCKPKNYKTPCNEAFFKFISDNFVIVAAVSIGIAIVLVFGMFFAIVLCCAIRETNV